MTYNLIANIKVNGEFFERVTPKKITKKNANSVKNPSAWYFASVEDAIAKVNKIVEQKQFDHSERVVLSICDRDGNFIANAAIQ